MIAKSATVLFAVCSVTLTWQGHFTSKATGDPLTKRVRILAAGDSITEGYYDRDGGYRRFLVDWLAPYADFDFVGPLGSDPLRHYAIAGIGGQELAVKLGRVVVNEAPDIILLHVGKVDLIRSLLRKQGSHEAAQNVIHAIRASVDAACDTEVALGRRPIVLLHELLPIGDLFDGIDELRIVDEINDLLHREVVEPRRHAGYPVDLIATVVPVDVEDLADGVHPLPGGVGFRKLATDYWAALLGFSFSSL